MRRQTLLALLALQVAALWPVWRWVAVRVGDSSGEGAALAAAAAALLIPPRDRDATSPNAGRSLWLPTAATLVYALSVVVAPPLVRAALGFSAVLATWSLWRWGTSPHPAAAGLTLLALPSLPTAQFLLGFPLRALAGSLAARLLSLGGLAVTREGVALRWGEQLVAIDAPCSGVQMLWAALLLALVLAGLGRFLLGRTLLLAAAAIVLAIAANGLRASALFLVEAGLVPLPLGGHDSVGLITFAMASLPLLYLYYRWQEPPCARPLPS